MEKKKRGPTPNQRKVLNIIEDQLRKGKKISVTKAMRESGVYAPSTASQPEKINTLPEFQEIIDKYLPDDHVGMRHRELLDKRDTETIFYGTGKKKKYQVIDKGPDVAAVKAALDMSYKIKGRYPKEGPNVAIQLNMREDSSFKQ